MAAEVVGDVEVNSFNIFYKPIYFKFTHLLIIGNILEQISTGLLGSNWKIVDGYFRQKTWIDF